MIKKTLTLFTACMLAASTSLFASTTPTKASTSTTTDTTDNSKQTTPPKSSDDTGLIVGVTAAGVVVVGSAIATAAVLTRKSAKAAGNVIEGADSSEALAPFNQAFNDAAEKFIPLSTKKLINGTEPAGYAQAETNYNNAAKALKQARSDLEEIGTISSDTEQMLKDLTQSTASTTDSLTGDAASLFT